jgi:hypothetical protein
MLIYLDSRDLIDLCQGSACIEISDFGKWLLSRSHRVVFSLQTLIELSDQLRIGNLLEVRKDLNRLENLPHTFVNEARICDLEMREAISAFEENREYRFNPTAPFGARIDQVADLYGEPQSILEGRMRVPTSMIVNYGIAEGILYLWRSDPHIFDVQRRRQADWQRMMEADRALIRPPSLEDNFVKKMAGDLYMHGISFPTERVEALARWVYKSPNRCPGIRLQYEAHHQFRRDKMSRTSASDIIDFMRTPAVPYVDFFIADKRMMGYCRQAAKLIQRPYPQLFGNLSALIASLD